MAGYGSWDFCYISDLQVLYHKLHVICDTKPRGLLPGAWKFLWRKHCNKTMCVLKRRVTATRRFKNYQKRLITFGFTVRNVKLFLRKSFEETLSSLLEFLARKLLGHSKFVFPEFSILRNNFMFLALKPKVINRF